MIDIKSHLDRLEDTASKFYKLAEGDTGSLSSFSSGDDLQTASDIRGAVQDISNLRDSNAILERNIREMSAEINTLKTAPVDLGSVINDAINGRIKAAMVDNTQLDALEARLELVEDVTLTLDTDSIDGLEQLIDDRISSAEMDGNREDATRDAVKDMIRDGDIIVSIDVS